MNLDDALVFATEHMEKHNLHQDGWAFSIMSRSGLHTYGVCDHRNKLVMVSRLALKHLPDAEIKDTILHEIAHALAGLRHRHDTVWRRMCIKVGAIPEATTPIRMYKRGKRSEW